MSDEDEDESESEYGSSGVFSEDILMDESCSNHIYEHTTICNIIFVIVWEWNIYYEIQIAAVKFHCCLLIFFTQYKYAVTYGISTKWSKLIKQVENLSS